MLWHILNNFTFLKIVCELLVYKELHLISMYSLVLVQSVLMPYWNYYSIMDIYFFFQNTMSHSKYGNYQLILNLKLR